MTTLCNQPELENSTLTFKLSDIVEQCITLALIDFNIEKSKIKEKVVPPRKPPVTQPMPLDLSKVQQIQT